MVVVHRGALLRAGGPLRSGRGWFDCIACLEDCTTNSRPLPYPLRSRFGAGAWRSGTSRRAAVSSGAGAQWGGPPPAALSMPPPPYSPCSPAPGVSQLDGYLELYNATATAINAVDPLISVGGPATASLNWVTEFINFTQGGVRVPAHFLSTHSVRRRRRRRRGAMLPRPPCETRLAPSLCSIRRITPPRRPRGLSGRVRGGGGCGASYLLCELGKSPGNCDVPCDCTMLCIAAQTISSPSRRRQLPPASH